MAPSSNRVRGCSNTSPWGNPLSQRELYRTLIRLLGYIRPYWLICLGAVICTFLVTFAKLSQAKFIGLIFGLMADRGAVKVDAANPLNGQYYGYDGLTFLSILCGSFLAMMVMMGLATYTMRYLVNLGGQLAIRDCRQQVFQHLQRLSLSFYDKMRLGEIQSRASGDVMTATGVYTQLADFLTNFLLVVMAMGWMVYHDWKMTGMVLLLSPLIGYAVGHFGTRVGRITEKIQSRAADLAAITYESLSNIKVVKAYGREDFESGRFGVKNEENFQTQMGLVKVQAAQVPVVEFLGALGIVAIVWFGAYRIMYDGVQFSQMTEYWTLLVMTTQPISALSGFYSSFQASAAAAQRVFYIVDTPSEAAHEVNYPELPAVEGNIVFDKVTFGYDPENPILNDLDLVIPPGQVVAIVGANGAGKTTLMNLVSRFYNPMSGTVSIDGHDLKTVKLESVRSQIGVVIQESVLFAGTIAENIACSDAAGAKESRERVLTAAQLANADDFIKRLPDGYDTQVGERGARLSGGQRQRIAIARALFRDPRILLLDEFTSNVDAESENAITDALEKSMRGRTCLVIAHRLNTIRHAHRILVMERGQIVEQGSHEELMARDANYSRIYMAQLQAEPTGGTPTETPTEEPALT